MARRYPVPSPQAVWSCYGMLPPPPSPPPLPYPPQVLPPASPPSSLVYNKPAVLQVRGYLQGAVFKGTLLVVDKVREGREGEGDVRGGDGRGGEERLHWFPGLAF